MIQPRLKTLGVAALCLVVLSACGPRRVKDQAPFVQVTSWRIDGQQLSADLRIRNVNDEPLPLARLSMRVTLDDTGLVDYEGPHGTEVAANGFETLQLRMQATAAGTALLMALQEGERASLPYNLSGRVHLTTGQYFPFERAGHIYTVPGKPGSFR